MVGSSVKPCTPCPVVYTSMVLEPYMTYPAATCLQPGCSTSASVPRPCHRDPAVDAEDRADRGVDVDVGGAVQRIEQHHVLARPDSRAESG